VLVKAAKEIHAILTETLVCFLSARAKDLLAPSSKGEGNTHGTGTSLTSNQSSSHKAKKWWGYTSNVIPVMLYQ